MKKVYCSGALFCSEEVAAMERIAAVLEDAGYATFLPHRDGVEAFVLNAVNSPFANLIVFRPVTRFVSRATFALDICELLECDYFVFNMDGVVPDEGGVVETGVAFAAGKPVVIYRSEAGRSRGLPEIPVIMGASYTFEAVSDIQEIPGALAGLAERLRLLGDNGYTADRLPGFVRRVAGFGRKIRWVLRKVRVLKPRNMMSPSRSVP
jgi:nucleoside 2-deoxyribosyltransferase